MKDVLKNLKVKGYVAKANLILIVGLLLSSCKPAQATETVTPMGDNQPTVTETMTPPIYTAIPDLTLPAEITATPDNVETAEEIDNILHDSCYYGRDEIDSYARIFSGTTEINDRTYNTIIGVDGEGQETILAVEMTTYTSEKVWTRISVTDLGEGNGQMIMWLNPDQDGATQVSEQTAEIFLERFLEVVRDGGQGASITGMQGGQMTLEVPYAYYETGGDHVRWEEETLDLHDVEMRIFQSPEEWQEFVRDYPEMAVKVFSSGLGRSGIGICIFPKDGGGTLMVVLRTEWEWILADQWSGDEPLWVNSIAEARDLARRTGLYSFWVSLTVFAYRQEGKLAFTNAVHTGQGQTEYPVDESTEDAFEWITPGFVENHSIRLP